MEDRMEKRKWKDGIEEEGEEMEDRIRRGDGG